ncbi:MAG: TonB-dependent receptor, partial [Leptospira sp.]|nr:TonB-dependent receptor [Leptospira sp.]
GVEGNQLKYNGDSFHNSNVDLNLLGTGQPFPNGGLMQLNPSMDWITNKPINKVAPFAQATSGKIIDKKLEFTLGVRYDETNIHFRGIDMPYGGILGYPTADITDSNGNLVYNGTVPTKNLGPPFVTNEKKVYRKTSPRAGVVFFATSDLTFKAMSGIAFREPSPGELFGVNTLVGGSNNPRKLSPEVIRTSEIAMDYFIKKYLNLRVNGFQTRFENVIDYNGTSNAVSNVYSVGTRGIESEILLSYKNITGFINYSRFQRFLDSNLDSLISKHPNEVTISPASIANAGTTVHWEKFMFSTSVHYQGATHRKTSDLGPIDPLTGYLMQNTYSDPNSYPQYRPKVIPAWTSVNLRTMYKFSENFQIGIYFTNIFNTTQLLVQRSDYPFDYIREGRRVMFEFIGNF